MFAHVLLLVIILYYLGLFSVLGDSRDPLLVVVATTTIGIRASRFWFGISEDSEGSRSDSVEIVCRSQIRGIWCSWRSCVDLRRTQGGLVESVVK